MNGEVGGEREPMVRVCDWGRVMQHQCQRHPTVHDARFACMTPSPLIPGSQLARTGPLWGFATEEKGSNPMASNLHSSLALQR